MTQKDYYAILMVHHSAEKFLIETAYRRLAREYHPDVSTAKDAHMRMVDINQAYEVLSDPILRKAYDAEYNLKSSIANKTSHGATTYSTSERSPAHSDTSGKHTTKPDNANALPIPPKPSSFGISPGYLEHAIEGAREWEKRQHALSTKSKQSMRIGSGIGGVTILLVFSYQSGVSLINIPWIAWVALPLLGEASISLIEHLHDTRLNHSVYSPRYNPNPDGYKKYAIEYAKYEAQVRDVYVSRNWKFHSNSYCCNMTNYSTMSRYVAVNNNISPCSHCGHIVVLPRQLPPPFGNGARVR